MEALERFTMPKGDEELAVARSFTIREALSAARTAGDGGAIRATNSWIKRPTVLCPHMILDRFFGYDLFISYSRADSAAYVHALATELTKSGYRCFLDSNEMAPGALLSAAVHRALRRSSVLLLVVSPQALASMYVRDELTTFAATGDVIPINVGRQLQLNDDDALRAELRKRIWIDETTLTAPSSTIVPEIRRRFAYVRRRVWRRTAAAATTAILVTLGIAAALYAQASKRHGREADDQAQMAAARARVVRSQQLARSSATALPDHLDRALLLAAEAIEIEATPEARDAAVTALHRAQSIRGFLHGHTDDIVAIAYTTAGTLISSAEDGSVRTWDVAALTEREAITHVLPARMVMALSGCARDAIVALGDAAGGIEILDTRTRARLASSTASESPVRSLQFDETCKLLVVGDDLGGVSMWHLDSDHLALVDRRIVDPGDRQRGVRSARLDDAATRVVVATNAGTLAVFGLTDGKLSSAPISTAHAQGSPVWDATFTQDGQRIVALENATLSVSTIAGRVQTSNHFDSVWLTLARLPGDQPDTFLASGKNLGLVSLTGTSPLIVTADVLAGTGTQPPIAMGPDGSSFATATDDHGIAIWSPRATPVWAEALPMDPAPGAEGALSPDGRRIAITTGSSVSLRDPRAVQASILSNNEVHGPLRDIVVSLRGEHVAIIDESGRALLWTPADDTMRALVASDRIASLARFSEDGTLLAIASTDLAGHSYLGLWDVTREKAPQSWSTPLVERITFSKKGNLLAVASDSSVAVMSLPVTDPKSARTFSATRGSVVALAISPDGERLAIADSAGGIVFWSTATLKPIGSSVLDDLHGNVQALSMSPDGKLVAVTTGDSVVLWDSDAGRRIGDALAAPHGELVGATFEGPTTLVAAIFDRRARWSVSRWQLDAGHLMTAARRIANRSLTAAERAQYVPGR